MQQRPTRDILEEAIARKIITDEQRAEMEAISEEDMHDREERIKPIGTLNEIFITVGVALLLWAVVGLYSLFLDESLIVNIGASLTCLFAAYYFHERKRYRLPVIYACLQTALFAWAAVKAFALTSDGGVLIDVAPELSVEVLPRLVALVVLALCAWRFTLPFLMLPIAILFTVTVTGAVQAGYGEVSLRLLLGGSGLAILAFAVAMDLKDPKRVTRLSDFAFWSYVVGSPLFVHSLFLTVLFQEEAASAHIAHWLIMLVLILVVSFAGLLMNRRALILSTMLYVGYVVFQTLNIFSGTPVTIALITMLLIGLYISSLGSQWNKVRYQILSRLEPWRVLKHVPPY